MHHSATSTATMAYPGLPASPTLTNPDMILPYGDYDSTPSPPRNGAPPSPPGAWQSSKPADMDFSIGPPRHLGLGLGPVTPTTPIIYGNGTMLSDIGEVTEAESTPGRTTRQLHTRISKGYDSPVRSSPTIGYNAVMKRSKIGSHKRTVSKESSSTITSEPHVADVLDAFDDFDDGVSQDDSNFQGDDEESVADDPYEHNVAVAQAKVLARKESKIVQGNDDSQSSAALSRRAEMILANAKKRLDNMEGNLSRARSSLYITPSSSMSSINSGGPFSRDTPSPQNERRILPQLGVPPSKHRQLNNAAIAGGGSPGHARVSSENSLPINPHALPLTARSVNVASGNVGTSKRETSPPKSAGSEGDNVRIVQMSSMTKSPSSFAPPLEPLSEDDTESVDSTRNNMIRPSTTEPYLTEHLIDHRGLTRATSAMQMRDLSEKMKDLKGKISTLRDRAREDTLKRRSLQSLRTPSPFTAAEQWYTSAKEYKGSGLRSGSGVVPVPWNDETNETGSVIEDDEHRDRVGLSNNRDAPVTSIDATQRTTSAMKASVLPQGREPHVSVSDREDLYLTAEGSDEEQDQGEDEGNENDEEFGAEGDDEEYLDRGVLDEYESEGEGSLYHDSLTTPVSHEDREDAFDYEHFFLHSAMGTISQQRHGRHDSSASFSSQDSVETTRGPTTSAPADEHSEAGRLKAQASRDSLSSQETFETAAENADPGGEEEENDDEVFAVQSVPTRPVSGSTTEEPTKRSTFGSVIPNGNSPGQISASYSMSSDGEPFSATRDTESQHSSLYRPSIASFSSTGTTRSFPLVNKPKPLSGIAASILSGERGSESPVGMLAREDQILVERLVASLGKCVLGLHESGRSSYEGRLFKRRLDAARRVLEGQEGAV